MGRIGALEAGVGRTFAEHGLTAPWMAGVDWAVPGAVVIAAVLLGGRMRRAAAIREAGARLAGLERAGALLDRVLALSYELEDRYGRREGPSEADMPAIYRLRRDMACTMADARAALEAHGDLAEPRLAEDAVLVAMRPVVEHPPTLGEGARSLERLRAMATRLRFEASEARDAARRRLGYRAHGLRRR